MRIIAFLVCEPLRASRTYCACHAPLVTTHVCPDKRLVPFRSVSSVVGIRVGRGGLPHHLRHFQGAVLISPYSAPLCTPVVR